MAPTPGDSTASLQNHIDRFKAGDRSARDELIARASDRLVQLTRRMLRGFQRVHAFEQTDDVFQNSILRLMRALDQVPLDSVEQFMRLTAVQIRRELIDLCRHYYGPHGAGNRERPLTPPASETETPASFGATADSTYAPEQLAFWTEFHQHVERLPEEERAVFDLLWYQGIEQAEAAAVLGVSVPTVKRRWMAARLRLREISPGSFPNS